VRKGEQEKGILYVVATPLGNLEDITRRAVKILSGVDLVAAEDTRRSRNLLSHLGLKKPFISHYRHNQKKSAKAVIEALDRGRDVALITDAGTPGISDPGALLVSEARGAGFKTVPVPGPSALAAAVSISDIPCDSFTFAGFLPAKKHARQKRLEDLKDRPETLIFYEAPHRLLKALEDMIEVLGDRNALVARELTKLHEEIISTPLSELIETCGIREIKGEITMIVEGCHGSEEKPDMDELKQELKKSIITGNRSVRETVDELAPLYPVSRRELYRLALEVKDRKK
jgi:16S rRNA (cytidine1402-2'-O)-methyltransferase